MAKTDIENPGLVVGSQAWATATVARAPMFPSVPDLLAVFGTRDLLLDAYARGWLPKQAEEALEANATRLHCWLEARILRVLLERPR